MDLIHLECHLRTLRNDILSLLKNTTPNKKKDFEVESRAQDAIDRIYTIIEEIHKAQPNEINRC